MPRKSITLIWRIPAAFLLCVLAIAVGMNVSPIYDFEETKPFSGDMIYNPYAECDTTIGWHRANLHTHTHSKAWINECEFYADSVLEFYKRYGYDIVTFSNHMEVTEYPGDKELQVDVYEHGYNIAKLHNLTFAPKAIDYRDVLVPFLPSQMQYKMDRLIEGADFIFLNHPDRTFFINDKAMQMLTGYRLVEADCGFADKDTYGHKWDVALSSGHYVPSAISDDLHKPRISGKIARRCCFFNFERGRYQDLKEALLSGCFYTMHLPDYGEGDLKIKTEKNHQIPYVTTLGVDTLGHPTMSISEPAVTITAIGQDGNVLAEVCDTTSLTYSMQDADTYVRFVARFADGVVIFSNPFARWSGGTASGTPYVDTPHTINWLLTVLFNGAVLCILTLLLYFAAKVLQIGAKKRHFR